MWIWMNIWATKSRSNHPQTVLNNASISEIWKKLRSTSLQLISRTMTASTSAWNRGKSNKSRFTYNVRRHIGISCAPRIHKFEKFNRTWDRLTNRVKRRCWLFIAFRPKYYSSKKTDIQERNIEQGIHEKNIEKRRFKIYKTTKRIYFQRVIIERNVMLHEEPTNIPLFLFSFHSFNDHGENTWSIIRHDFTHAMSNWF